MNCISLKSPHLFLSVHVQQTVIDSEKSRNRLIIATTRTRHRTHENVRAAASISRKGEFVLF